MSKTYVNVTDFGLSTSASRHVKEIQPGAKFTAEDAGENLEMFLKAGWCEEFVEPEPEKIDGESVVLQPEKEKAPALIEATSEVKGSMSVKREGAEEAKGDPTSRASAFALDPDALRGISLEALNGMVAERDASIGALDTVEEAIAILSADYVEK